MNELKQGWKSRLDDEFKKDYYLKLEDFINHEYENEEIFPTRENLFTALNLTDISEVKVVILGQDPYHDVNQAHGLSFSVPQSQKKIPPSLKNIYKELESDCNCYIPNNGNLTKWANQGVLLLNTVLTVRAHKPASHKGKGWEKFTDRIIEELNKEDRPIVFLLWGNPAKEKLKMLNNSKHLVLCAAHPSPLSAYRGFFGCKHFSKTNEFLINNKLSPIDWQIENV
ncbi:uracil-DNA glycosylase [Lachnospira multipara]|jgi:uracil-DNA glycosylase|uniref:uracil-DNA glycosylase n=1 Tax=Lachnospira multipara TaxID=28051 RepID=UPI0004898C03